MISRRYHIAALVVLGSAIAASAQEPTSLGKFENWEAYTYKAKDSRVCYIYSAPVKTESPKKVKRDPVYLMVTHWPGRKVRDQVSTIIGYPFKEESVVKMAVDGKSFDLYTNGDMAWADGAETDHEIVVAMKGGTTLTLSGTSWRGTPTTDTYSLSGMQTAMTKIDETCK